MAASTITLVRVAGALLGTGGAAFALVDALPSASYAALPARASFTVPVTGELGVAPARALTARALEPGAPPARGSFTLRNETGKALDVGLKATVTLHDLDGLLRVRLTAGATTLADTTLQGLQNGTTLPARLRAGTSRRIAIEAWIPAAVTDGHQGRSVAVTLTPTSRPVA